MAHRDLPFVWSIPSLGNGGNNGKAAATLFKSGLLSLLVVGDTGSCGTGAGGPIFGNSVLAGDRVFSV